MSGRNARFHARTSVTRVLGIVAVLAGILLLQGSLCDGSLTPGVPCVASCDEVLASVVDHPVEVAVGLAAPDLPGDQDGLVSLCVTVLLAVLGVLAVLRRPDVSRAVARASSAPPAAPHRGFALPQLCVLRI